MGTMFLSQIRRAELENTESERGCASKISRLCAFKAAYSEPETMILDGAGSQRAVSWGECFRV